MEPCSVCSETVGNMYICYILDGILILYGIILTVLYCRLRVRPNNNTNLVVFFQSVREIIIIGQIN